jgi:hypothetical protein
LASAPGRPASWAVRLASSAPSVKDYACLLAIAAYLWDAEKDRYAATGLDVLDLSGGRIVQLTAFATPEIFPRFGLPELLSR